jgi:hypothetical protein
LSPTAPHQQLFRGGSEIGEDLLAIGLTDPRVRIENRTFDEIEIDETATSSAL